MLWVLQQMGDTGSTSRICAIGMTEYSLIVLSSCVEIGWHHSKNRRYFKWVSLTYQITHLNQKFVLESWLPTNLYNTVLGSHIWEFDEVFSKAYHCFCSWTVQSSLQIFQTDSKFFDYVDIMWVVALCYPADSPGFFAITALDNLNTDYVWRWIYLNVKGQSADNKKGDLKDKQIFYL